MKTREKVMFAVLGTLVFFMAGGVACTYSTTQGFNWGLVTVFGLLVFLTVGASVCTYSNSKLSKTKVKQIAQ